MRSRTWSLISMIAATIGLAALSFALRSPCLGSTLPSRAVMWGTGCYSDLQVMWNLRGLADHVTPYLQPVQLPDGRMVTVEYPVLGGLLMWMVSLAARTFRDFVMLCTVVSGVCAVGITILLHRHVGRLAWLWAASPALVLYLSYNIDALPALVSVAGVLSLRGQNPVTVRARRYLGAAVLFGIGGALKLYPLLFLLALVPWLVRGCPGPEQTALGARIGRGVRAALAAIGVLLVVNLPVAIANLDGWLMPFRFQAERSIDASTLSMWFYLGKVVPSLSQAALMAASTVTTGAALLMVVVWSWRAAGPGEIHFGAVCVALLAAYLLLNKVFSPQYILWLLPLVVALPVLRPIVTVSYVLLDPVIYWGWYLGLFAREVGQPVVGSFWDVVRLVGVGLRWLLVVLVLIGSRPAGPLGSVGRAGADSIAGEDAA